MLVTEAKLIAESGYTKSEIKNRRQRYWIEGQHFFYDGGRKAVYDIEAIGEWQKGSPKKKVDVGSITRSTELDTSNDYQSHTRLQELRKRKKYV